MNHATSLHNEFKRRRSMTIEAARMFLEHRGASRVQADAAINAGASKGWWKLGARSLLPNTPAMAAVAESMDDVLADSLRDRGAMYHDGVFATLADAGIDHKDARQVVARAVKSGRARVSGSVLVAAEDLEERLTQSEREELPKSAFAWPEERKFPVHDRAHTIAAVGKLNLIYKRGYIDDDQYRAIYERIMRAYDRFGLTARKPPLVPMATMRRAAEAAAEEKHMAAKKLTKAQRRQIAMKNLRKAWAATGTKPKSSGRKSKAREVSEPAGYAVGEKKKKSTGPKKTPEELYQIRMANLRKAWSAMGTPVKPAGAAPAPSAAPARAPRTAGTTTRAGKPKSKRRKTAPAGRYMSPDTGAIIRIERVYPKENPVVLSTTNDMIGAGGGLLLGLLLSDVTDRLIATRAPKDAKDALIGPAAARAIRSKPDAVRMGAQLGGAVAFGAAAYGMRNYSAIGAHIAGGITLGFLIRLFAQVVGGHVMPAVFKAQSPAEKSFSNRAYADVQAWEQEGAQPAVPATPPAPATPAGADQPGQQLGVGRAPMLMPPGFQWQQRGYGYGPGYESYGPVASNAAGTVGNNPWFCPDQCGPSDPMYGAQDPCSCGPEQEVGPGGPARVPPAEQPPQRREPMPQQPPQRREPMPQQPPPSDRRQPPPATDVAQPGGNVIDIDIARVQPRRTLAELIRLSNGNRRNNWSIGGNGQPATMDPSQMVK